MINISGEKLTTQINGAHLGLNSCDLPIIVSQVSSIIHVAASVSLVKPYQILRETNVTPILDILRIATLSEPTKRILHISSLSAFGSKMKKVIAPPIKELALDPPALLDLDANSDAYGCSKSASEYILEHFNNGGSQNVPIDIIRPGFVSFHSVSGRCNHYDTLTTLIHGLVHLGVFPTIPSVDARQRFAPVDWVASLIVDLLEQHSTSKFIGYHNIYGPPENDISLYDIVDSLARFGFPLKPCSNYKEWLALVLAKAENSPLFTLIPTLENGLPLCSPVIVESSCFRSCPCIASDFFLHKYFSYMKNNGLLE